MAALEEGVNRFRTAWHTHKEKWLQGDVLDPVFEGVVKDFNDFDVTMQEISKKVDVFMKGVDSLADGLVKLSEATIAGLTHVDDDLIKADSCKAREATNQITRADAPHSAIAKLRRDMNFNIVTPIRSHLSNNRTLKARLEQRRLRMSEFNYAKKQYDDCVKRGLRSTDRRFLQAQSVLEASRMSFQAVDKHIFEWLYILEEYKGDILDSTLQTLKYLQYEFFATSAHAISSVLPARMEFRPMVEMTPDHLEAQVEMEIADDEDSNVTEFSVRLIEKLAKDNKSKPGEGVDSCSAEPAALPVDPLSLSSLLSQGFDEGPARRALRLHRNDTQAAMDWLINGPGEDAGPQEDKVRMPTTVRRVQRLKAKRRAQQDTLRMQQASHDDEDRDEEEDDDDDEEEDEDDEDDDDDEGPRPAQSRSATLAGKNPAPPEDLLGLDSPPAEPAPRPQGGDMDLLSLSEAPPPPPTDFRSQPDTAPLPPQRAFDLSKCEKQPLPASVAAGTASLRGADDAAAPPPAGSAEASDAAVRCVLAAQASSQAPNQAGLPLAVADAFEHLASSAGAGYPMAAAASTSATAPRYAGQPPPPPPPPPKRSDGDELQSLNPFAGAS